MNRNQGGQSLSVKERKGIQKLRNRIKDGEIVVFKTEKSRQIVVVNNEECLKMGRTKKAEDRKI